MRGKCQVKDSMLGDPYPDMTFHLFLLVSALQASRRTKVTLVYFTHLQVYY
jgi:hypothetical protein